MPHQFDQLEGTYRIVDALYRLHHDLFETENILTRTARMQFRLAQMMINGRAAVMIVGLLAIIPILVSLGDIKWGSAPAITIYLLAGAVLALWIAQVVQAGRVDHELTALEGYTSTDALEDRMDFVLEQVNAWTVRHRLVNGILSQLSAAAHDTSDESQRAELAVRKRRYEEILKSCEDYVGSSIEASERLVREKKRSKEDHDELLDWAAGIPKFAPPEKVSPA